MRQSRCKKIRVQASDLYDKVKARGLDPASVGMIERRLRQIYWQKRQAGQWGVGIKRTTRIAKFVEVGSLANISREKRLRERMKRMERQHQKREARRQQLQAHLGLAHPEVQ